MKLFLIALIFLTSCDFDSKKRGIYTNSQSIEESKQNGVFIQSLKINKPFIKIGDNKKDSIIQIWTEWAWTYEGFFATVKKDTSFQHVLILFKNFSTQDYENTFLKHRASFFGWNGVLFNTYTNLLDTVFIVDAKNENRVFDTLVIDR